MSHIVLARKYRPKSFEEVIGQDNSVLILQSFISNDSIPHSLIFCGGRGVGKLLWQGYSQKQLILMKYLKTHF